MTARDTTSERDPRWSDSANCRGVDVSLFYPERGEPVDEAKAICDGCVVRDQCLEYALARGEKHGIWGGKAERERRILRRERKAAAAARQAGQAA